MIKLIRIDDRLLHGQVVFTWVPSLGIDCIVVANDKVAKDDFQKMTLGLAKPPGAKLLIKSVSETAVFLNDEKSRPSKIIVLINSVQDAFSLANEVHEIQSINFGGVRVREGARQISKAISITDSDVILIKELYGRGVELEIRQVPSDQKQKVETLI